MRFMVLVKGNTDYEAGRPPSPELMAAIARLAEKDSAAGRLIATGGLMPSSAGARVRAARGKVTVTDGPFAEAKELIGGYAILEVESREAVLQMAREFMQTHIDVLGPSFEGECEVRQISSPPHGEPEPGAPSDRQRIDDTITIAT
ncbi:MAG TPA: YciI family protein [Gemmatimonadaceae bacterium]|nr:YciI family protein [Gemmatimonadaceae bacterium]